MPRACGSLTFGLAVIPSVAHALVTGATAIAPSPSPLPAAGPSPSPSACNVAQDTDYAGGDYRSQVVASAESCCAICAEESQCDVAVLSDGVCYLKSGAGAAHSSPGRVAVVPGAGPAPPPSPTPPPAPTPPPVVPTTSQCQQRPGNVEIEIPHVHYHAEWVGLVNATFGAGVEDLACPEDMAELDEAGIESCDVGETYESMITWKFKPGQFDLTKQMFLPANTAIVGAGNPNHWQDHRRKPDVASNTFFVGTTDQPGNDWVSNYGNNKPDWSRGFVMNNRTVIRNINVQGSDLGRRSGSYTGGAAFELPGCNTDLVSRDGKTCADGSTSMNGNGQPVHDVLIENVRINDLLFDHGPTPYADNVRATQGLFYNGMIPGDRPHRNVTLNNAVSMFSWADGVNVHGHIVGFRSDYLYIESPGDDSIGLWGVGDRNTPETDVHFQNFFSYDSGNPDFNTGACMKAFGTGPAVTFTGYFVCCSPAGGAGHPDNPDHGGVAVWLSPCCTADWDPALGSNITIDADFAWAAIDADGPLDMCSEPRCGGDVCNPWTAGSLLLPSRVQMPPYYGSFGSIANPDALVLTDRTTQSCHR